MSQRLDTIGDSDGGGPVTDTSEAPPGTSSLSDRLALWVFVGLVAVSGLLILVHFGRNRWFLNDDWDYLSARSLTDVPGLFRPHNEHWTTLPIVGYRVMFHFFGMRSFAAYQAMVVAADLTTVVLLRAIMRRAGAGPWIATVAAGSLLLFGAGDQNITAAFQITFTGAFAFGLGQLLLADHDGGLDRRDAIGLTCGLLGLMCSGVGITMVVIVGVTTLLRRGWRISAFHTIPLAVVYATWWVIERPPTAHNPFGFSSVEIARAIWRFTWSGIVGTFTLLGGSGLVGALLLVMLVAGLVLAWWGSSLAELRRRAAAVIGLLIGAVVFLAISGYGRWWFGADYARTSRYIYCTAALLLPALAVAATALARRWKLLLPVVLVVLLLGVPSNINKLEDASKPPSSTERLVAAYVASPYAPLVPPRLQPDPAGNPLMTIGFLLRVAAAGDLPDTAARPDLAEEVRVRLGIDQQRAPVADGMTCSPVTEQLDVRPELGAAWELASGTIVITPIDDDGKPTGRGVSFARPYGQRLTVRLAGLHVRVDSKRAVSAFCS